MADKTNENAGDSPERTWYGNRTETINSNKITVGGGHGILAEVKKENNNKMTWRRGRGIARNTPTIDTLFL